MLLICRSWLSTTRVTLEITHLRVWTPVPLQVRLRGPWSSCCCFWSQLVYLGTNTAVKSGGRSSLHAKEARRRRRVTRPRRPSPIHTSMWGDNVHPSRYPFMKTWQLNRLKATRAEPTRGGKRSYLRGFGGGFTLSLGLFYIWGSILQNCADYIYIFLKV